MRVIETITQRYINELEKALLEYIETYGPTDRAKNVFNHLSIARAEFVKDFEGLATVCGLDLDVSLFNNLSVVFVAQGNKFYKLSLAAGLKLGVERAGG